MLKFDNFGLMKEKIINGYQLEICANSLYSAKEAQKAGASRVELCQNLENGGTTPSYGLIKLTREQLSIGLHVLIRPRGGDFLYSEEEFQEIVEDIRFCKEVGCDGVVIGVLKENAKVDISRMKMLIEEAKPMVVVFHRAFDLCANPNESLEQLIFLGCDRVLTSGQQETAMEGRGLIKELVSQAAGRIEVMPGSGVHDGNIVELLKTTGAKSVHSSAKVVTASKMKIGKQRDLGMGGDLIYSCSEEVTKLIEQIKSL